tara:strand:+ start:575 stop:1057 length:483 start_codon:yes stop_codon:yes gene_type:complete
MPFRGQGSSSGGGGSGTVTSVAVAADTGTGGSITSAGTITLNGSGGVSTSVSGTTVTISGGGSSLLTTVTVNVFSSPYTVASNVDVVFVDANSGNITINLPSTATDGRVIRIVDQGASGLSYNTTVDGNGSNINGLSSFTINSSYQALNVIGDGSDYFIF